MDYTVHAERSLFLYLFPQLFIDVLKLDPRWRQCFRLGTAVLPRLCYCPNWRCESAAESAQSSQKKKQFTWGSVFFRSPSLLSRPNLVTVWLSHNQRLTDTHIDLSMKNQWGRVMGGSRRVSWSQRVFLRWFCSVSTLYGSSKWIICDPGYSLALPARLQALEQAASRDHL